MFTRKIVTGFVVLVLVALAGISAMEVQRAQASGAAATNNSAAIVKAAAQGNASPSVAAVEARHGDDGREGGKKGKGGDEDSKQGGARVNSGKANRGEDENERGNSKGIEKRGHDDDDAFEKFEGNNRKSAEVKGTIVTLTANSFTIGNTTIALNGATRIEGTLAVGARVQVKVVRQSGGTLLATKIEVNGRGHEDQEGDDDDDDEDEDNGGGAPVTPQLPAPTSLTASLVATQVNLAWADNSANETGFRIERTANSSFSANLVTFLTTANITSYGDPTAPAGNTYYYRVFAYNGAGSSATSNIVAVTVVDPSVTPPAAPSGLTALVSGTSANLAWVDNSANETGFRIERATDSFFTLNLTVASAATNVTAYTDTTVAGGTTYYYKVFSHNAGGNSLPSNTASVSLPASSIDAATLYASYCATCHGSNHSGLVSGRTLAQVQSDIRNGPGSMPAFSSTLSSAQISALAQWLKTTP